MTDFRELCTELLEDAIELADLMQGVLDGDYTPDCLTLQPIKGSIKRARLALAQPEPQGPKLIYRYSPATIAECGGPCEQGPQYCNCGQIKGEPEPQGPTDEALLELFNQNNWNYISPETFLDIAHSVLELQ